MRRSWIPLLACPCSGRPYELDPVRVAGDEVVEAFLVSEGERDVRPVVSGVAVLPRDLRAHLRTTGSVYRRGPVNDPRLARFLLGRAGSGHDAVRFEEVVGHYRDLAADPPAGYDTSRHPADVALEARLRAVLGGEGERRGRGLVVGCGVGRAVFVLAARLEAVLGVERSAACVRRARNIAVTREHFFLPAPPGSGLKEIPLDLSGLTREGADFAVAEAEALPLAAGAFDVVVLGDGDALGPWGDPQRARAEARRVLRPGGHLLETPRAASAGAPA